MTSGTSCVPTCEIGYTASPGADLTITCSLGVISKPNTCQPSPCDPPTLNTASTDYSSCSPTTASGSKCTPTCQPTYTPKGNLAMNCHKGIFSRPAGACESASSCKIPTSPSSINYLTATCLAYTDNGGTCLPTCQPEYNDVGDLSRLCVDGTFQSAAGSCNAL